MVYCGSWNNSFFRKIPQYSANLHVGSFEVCSGHWLANNVIPTQMAVQVEYIHAHVIAYEYILRMYFHSHCFVLGETLASSKQNIQEWLIKWEQILFQVLYKTLLHFCIMCIVYYTLTYWTWREDSGFHIAAEPSEIDTPVWHTRRHSSRATIETMGRGDDRDLIDLRRSLTDHNRGYSEQLMVSAYAIHVGPHVQHCLCYSNFS